MFSNLSILLFDKNTRYIRWQLCKPVTWSIKFLRKFNSVRLTRPVRFVTLVIRLFARFKTLSSDKWLMFSIRDILLLWRSKTSSLERFWRFLICSIWFLPSISTRSVGIVCSWEISLIWLLYKSRKIRFGRLTRFSIFWMLLCCKFSRRSLSSPSSNGMWESSRLSRFNLSGLDALSEGLR